MLTKNTYITKLKDIFVDTGLKNNVAEYTRPNKNGGGTLINLVTLKIIKDLIWITSCYWPTEIDFN